MSDDYAGNTSTTAILNLLPIVNNSVSINGNIEVVGDHDWFKVNLTAGQSYSFALNSITLGDNHLYLNDASGTLIIANDDSGGNGNALISSFIATYSGFYYLEASKHAENGTGTYTLTASGNISTLFNGIAVNGNYAYIADSTNGLQIKDVSNPRQPHSGFYL